MLKQSGQLACAVSRVGLGPPGVCCRAREINSPYSVASSNLLNGATRIRACEIAGANPSPDLPRSGPTESETGVRIQPVPDPISAPSSPPPTQFWLPSAQRPVLAKLGWHFPHSSATSRGHYVCLHCEHCGCLTEWHKHVLRNVCNDPGALQGTCTGSPAS